MGTSQHFVPQYYFRHFSEGRRCISLLRKADSRIIHNASIKGQCARHKYYGSDELERIFSQLEAQHANALRHFIEYAWFQEKKELQSEKRAWMWQAVLFQRARTRLQFKKMFGGTLRVKSDQ